MKASQCALTLCCLLCVCFVVVAELGGQDTTDIIVSSAAEAQRDVVVPATDIGGATAPAHSENAEAQPADLEPGAQLVGSVFHVDSSQVSHARKLLDEADGDLTPLETAHELQQQSAPPADEKQDSATSGAQLHAPITGPAPPPASACGAACTNSGSDSQPNAQEQPSDTDTAQDDEQKPSRRVGADPMQQEAHAAPPHVTPHGAQAQQQLHPAAQATPTVMSETQQQQQQQQAAAQSTPLGSDTQQEQQPHQPVPAVTQATPERPKRMPAVIPTLDDFERENAAAEKAAGSGLVLGGTGAAAPGADMHVSDAAGLLSGLGAVATGGGAGTEHEGPHDGSSAPEDDGRRINLAAAADGAAVVAANKEARKPEKTIDSDDDSFMKNACSAHKWIILELSQLGRVDEVEFVNKEMYSSRVKEFVVKGRQSHPRKDGSTTDYTRSFESDSWQLLGSFTAANKKGAQSFRMPVRRRVRYLLLQFLTHYGSEEVCALNSISVLGVSAAQELEEALARHLHPEPAVDLSDPPIMAPIMVVTPSQVAAVVTGAGAVTGGGMAAPTGAVAPTGEALGGVTGAASQAAAGLQQGVAGAGSGMSDVRSPTAGNGATTGLQGAPVAAPAAAAAPAGQVSGSSPTEAVALQLPGSSVTPPPAAHATPAPTASSAAGSTPEADVDQQPHGHATGTQQAAAAAPQPTQDAPLVVPLLGQEQADTQITHGLDATSSNGSGICGNVTNGTASFSNASVEAHGGSCAQPQAPVGSLELPQLPSVGDANGSSNGSSSLQPSHNCTAAGAATEQCGGEAGSGPGGCNEEEQGSKGDMFLEDEGAVDRVVEKALAGTGMEGGEEPAAPAAPSAPDTPAAAAACTGPAAAVQPEGTGKGSGAEGGTQPDEAPSSLGSPVSGGGQKANLVAHAVREAPAELSSGHPTTPAAAAAVPGADQAAPLSAVKALGAGTASPSAPTAASAAPAQTASLDRVQQADPVAQHMQVPPNPVPEPQPAATQTVTIQPATAQPVAAPVHVPLPVPVVPLPLPHALADVPPSGYFDALLSAMEGGPAAKPKQAGNLFDVFKQEFLIMRVNQTRMWKYISSLVEVLNKNAASAHEEVTRLEGVVTQLRAQIEAMPAQIEADTLRKVVDLPREEPAQIQQLALALAQLQRDVRQGRLREYALLLYSSALLGAMLSNMGARSRAFRRLLMALSIFNGLVGLTLQSPTAQKAVQQLVQQHIGSVGPFWLRFIA